MPTPEGKVKERVKKLLKEFGAYYHMPVQNGMGSPSLDFVGCHCSFFFGIETKAEKKVPTPRQISTMIAMEEAGASTFLVNEIDGLEMLERWLKTTQTDACFVHQYAAKK